MTFSGIYWLCSSQIQALLQQDDHLLSVGCRIFLESVASNYKCFSLQHICPKWSFIAHWRMHDIKCLQTWSNHVLSLLEIVRTGIVLITTLEQRPTFLSHTRSVIPCPFSSCQSYTCERLYLFYWYICWCYCLLHEHSGFPGAVEMHSSWRYACGTVQEGPGILSYHTSIRLSSGMNIWSCSIFS